MSDFEDLSPFDRLKRMANISRREAEAASELGESYDRIADEIEAEVPGVEDPYSNWPIIAGDEEWGDFDWVDDLDNEGARASETIIRDNLARDVRYYLANGGDVIDAGSVDNSFISALGEDICVSPALLTNIAERAKEISNSDKIKLEDMISAKAVIEDEGIKGQATIDSVAKLIEYGIDPDEVIILSQTNPAKIRSYSRLVQAPVLADYLSTVKIRVKQGEVLGLDDFIGNALTIVYMNSEFHSMLDAGDQDAKDSVYRRSQTDKKFAAALGEAMLHQASSDVVSYELPDPQDDFKDIPRDI